MHGGFGVGPGQKKSSTDVGSSPSSPTLVSQEEAAAESMNITFGEGSYARKLLKGMGWKEVNNLKTCSVQLIISDSTTIGLNLSPFVHG